MRKKIFTSAILLISFYALHGQIAFDPIPDFFRTTCAITKFEASNPKDIFVADYGAVTEMSVKY